MKNQHFQTILAEKNIALKFLFLPMNISKLAENSTRIS